MSNKEHEESLKRDKENRYNFFIKECQKVCSAYGITMEQYINVTKNINIVDFKHSVKFSTINEWQESDEFVSMYKKNSLK